MRAGWAGWITRAGWATGAGWVVGASWARGAGCSMRGACECEAWAQAHASLDEVAWAMVEPRSGGVTLLTTAFCLMDLRNPIS
ncbi:hypothetical protein COP2_025480 [Malus domestica]